MAQNDNLKRYLDAGMAFTQLTRERAEALVNDLVKAGEIRRKEAQEQIEELLERSQKNSEFLMGIIRKEVADQLRNLGLTDLARRADTGSARPSSASSSGGAGTQDSGATQTSAPVADPPSASKKQAAAKKTPAKKSAPAAKKAPGAAKAPAAGKSTSTAKASPAKKSTGKKSAPPA